MTDRTSDDFDLPAEHYAHPGKIKLPHLPDALDMRSKVAQALRANEEDILADLGGRESLSALKLGLVRQAALALCFAESLEAWLILQENVFGRPEMLPWLAEVRHYQAAYLRLARQLGLSRRLQEKGPASLGEYIKAKRSGRAAKQEAELDDAP